MDSFNIFECNNCSGYLFYEFLSLEIVVVCYVVIFVLVFVGNILVIVILV